MASVLKKTVVATGASSGIGFDVIKQLLLQAAQPYRFILGVRDVAKVQAACQDLKFDAATHDVTVLPLDLLNIKNVKPFAHEVVQKLGPQTALDYLLLNAGMAAAAADPAPGSKWSQSYVVNHLSQHYLVHLLREKLVASKSRIVVVSSGAVRNVPDPSVLDADLKAGSGASTWTLYSDSKFVQLLGAHWWRRQLAGQCVVVATSPGLVPGTGLSRAIIGPPKGLPDEKTVPEGARSVLAAFARSDFPADSDQIFLTSWGEWWPKAVYKESLDRALQDKWSPSLEEIEREEGIAA